MKSLDEQVSDCIERIDAEVRVLDELLNGIANTYKTAGVANWALCVDERAFTFEGGMTDEVFVVTPEGVPTRVTESLLRYAHLQTAAILGHEMAAMYREDAVYDEDDEE